MMDYSFIVNEEYSNGKAFENSNPLSTGQVSLIVEREDLIFELLSLEAELHAEDAKEKGRDPCLIS